MVIAGSLGTWSVDTSGNVVFDPGEGTWSVDTSGNVVFDPDPALTTDPTPINYTVEDNDGNTSNEATLTVTYGGAPVANDDSASNPSPVSDTNTTTVPLIGDNDTDPDGTIDPSTIILIDPNDATNTGDSTNPLVIAGEGTWSVDTSGNVVFDPDPALTTDPTPINYTVEDNDGNTSNEATLTVTYGEAPVANDDSASNPSPVSDTNTTTLPSIGNNDTDPDGTIDPSTIILIDPNDATNTGDSTNPLVIAGEGTWSVDTSGNVVFDPDPALTTDPTPINYTVEDNDGNTSNEATLTVTYGGAQTPNIEVNKRATPSTITTAGEVISYTITATNTGNVTLEEVVISDPLLTNLSCELNGNNFANDGSESLAVGEVVTCQGSYTATLADINAEEIRNVVTTRSETPSGNVITDTDTETVIVTQAPSIEIDKDSSNNTSLSVGDTVNYTFTVINTGNVTLDNISITDPLPNLSTIICPQDSLEPNESMICTASYIITQADVDAGSITNTATVTGNPPKGDPNDPDDDVTDTDTETIPPDQAPNIEVNKRATPSTITTAGEVISYTITATNTGNVTLEEVVISDPLLTNLSCELNGNNFANDGSESLAVGEVVTCQGSYTATLADINAEEIRNVVTTRSETPSGNVITDTDTETVIVTQAPSIEIDKDSSNNTSLSVGDTVNYTFTVINTGNVTLDNISITDPLPNLSTIICPQDSLEPNESMICTASYIITQADVDAGSITNTATVTGNPPKGDPNDPDDDVTDTDTETIPPDQAPNIEVNKRATPSTITTAGEVISYTITATNTGNVTLEEVVISDPLLTNLSCELNGNNFANDGSESLAVGEVVTCQGSYTATLADINAEEIRNVVTTRSETPSGNVITDTDTETVIVTQAPSIEIDKDSSNNTSLSVGDTVNYTFTVINTGNVTLDNISITDPLPNLSTIICPQDSLEPNESMICTASYIITQADVDAGSITNTATVTGNPPKGDPNDPDDDVTDTDTETIPPDQAPNIEVNKRATPSTITTAGEVISYTITATNTGNVTLEEVVISDPLLTNLSCELNGNNFANDGSESLAVGEVVTCQGSYTATLADINAEEIRNVVTTRSETPSGNVITDTDTETVIVTQAPSIEIDKDSSNNTSLSVGDTVNYTFTVINTGNVTLDNISITDPLPNLSTIICPQDSLEPNESMICTASYIITQADVDAGSITNTATVTGNPPKGDPNDPDDDVTDTDTETIPPDQAPNIEVNKRATPSTITTAGEVISYTITATNTGNVTLEEVVISDPLLTNLSCELNGNNFANDGSESLAVGEVVTCQGSYTATLADINAEEIRNVVTTRSETPSGNVITDTDTETVIVTQAPSIEIDKDSSNNTSLSVGDTVNYTFTVINTGNVTLDNISITDPLPNLSTIICPQDSLEPNESMICTASYIITQADVDAGSITNTATVTGNPPKGDPNDPDDDVTDTDTETIPPDQAPNIEVNKRATPSTITTAGEVISYTITATNTGNVTLEEVVISDPLLTNLSCELNGNNFANDGSESLAVGEVVTCQGSYTATLADINAEEIRNVVTTRSETPSGNVITDTDTETVIVTQAPSIEIDKDSSNNTSLSVGDTVNYTFTVINTGNVTLDNISITDPLPNLSTIICPQDSLEPNESMICTASYIITQADVDAGSITNTATVTGNPPKGDPNDPDDDVTDTDTETIPPDQAPNIEVNKRATPSTITTAGEVISYTITATNTGNVTLEEVVISDPLLTNLSCELNGNNFANDGSESLAVGEVVTCQGSYTATLADINAEEIRNVVTTRSETPSGNVITDTDTETVIVTQAPSIEIDKDSSNNTSLSVGDTVNYTFTVINTGNVTLDNISITDPLPNLSTIICPQDSLEPNESMICTASYIITQADVDAGSITNTATVTGNPPKGDPNDPDDDVTDTDTETIPPLQEPMIGVAKDVQELTLNEGTGVYTIKYSITIRNYGNTTLNNIQVSDDLDQTFGRNSYTFVRIDSDDFTINSAYDGSDSINLLLGTDSLGVDESGTVLVTLTVDGKQLANETTFNNSAVASAKDPTGNETHDTSVHGLDPDVGGGDPSNDNDGDPTNNTRPTPVTLEPKEPGEIALRIEKNVPQRIYAIGEIVPYTVIITSDNQVEDLIVDITDTLPQSTSYVEGTATISVSNAPQDVEFIAKEGQLTWLDVRLPAGEKITITYELLIGLNAPKLLNNLVEAKGTNTTGSAEVSVEANAEIKVSEEIFDLSTNVLIGRVYLDVDGDGSYDFDEDIPLPGARVVLSNGWQTVTDVRGSYMFRSVPVGTASVRLDALTAPYLPRENYQGIGDGYLHQVSIYGLSVSDFPLIAPKGAIDAQRRTTVIFGPITLEKKLIPLPEGVRVVLHINSSEPVPYKIRLLDPVLGLETKVFELEEVDGEQTFTYDVPMEIPMTDPTFEWGNQ